MSEIAKAQSVATSVHSKLEISEHAQKSKNSKEFLGHENPLDSHKPSVFDKSAKRKI